MIKNFFILIFSFQILFSASLDDFEYRQEILLDVKKVIQREESIARAYQQYLLNNYSLPSSINLLYTTDYLGSSDDFKDGISAFLTKFKEFSIIDESNISYISYRLTDTLKNDSNIKTLYESDTFRKITYYRNNKIYFTLEDSFAKHLYDLIKITGTEFTSPCASIENENCILNNHIYIKPTYSLGLITDYLMAYHVDKFKTGPIIITSNTSLHSTSDEFQTIPKGALLYDTTGAKYVKTTTSIEVLK
jgi:hypothetical protein